jgi:hypothetical protein
VAIKCEIGIMRPVVRFSLLLFRCFCFVGICAIVLERHDRNKDKLTKITVYWLAQFVYPGGHHFLLCQFVYSSFRTFEITTNS